MITDSNIVKMAPRACGRAAMHVMLPACMGGWCTSRDHCGQHLSLNRTHVSERLCERGDEHPTPVIVLEVDA